MSYVFKASLDQPSHNELSTAFCDGVEAALSIAVGQVFNGAWGAAERLGYFENKKLRSVFSEAYLSTMKDRGLELKCDEHGVILSLGVDK